MSKINHNLFTATYKEYLAGTRQDASVDSWEAFENLPLDEKWRYHDIALNKIFAAKN